MTNQFDFLYDTFFVIQFILLWGCYHINRTYLIIKKSYITLLCLECSTILIASGCLFLSITSAVKLPISSALYAPFTLSFIWCALIFLRKRTPPEKSFRKNIFEYTASNLLTGGMLFSLPFLIGYFSSIEYAALTSLLMSIGNFIILPARALSNHFLPDLCKIKNPGPSFSQTLRAFEKNLWTITTITTVIVYCFALIAFSYLPSSYSQLDYFNFALPSTLLCIYFSQLSLPLSNALLALNMSSLTMTVNLVAAAVFAIIVCGFILFSSLHAAPSILIGLSISNIARFMILKIKAADL